MLRQASAELHHIKWLKLIGKIQRPSASLPCSHIVGHTRGLSQKQWENFLSSPAFINFFHPPGPCLFLITNLRKRVKGLSFLIDESLSEKKGISAFLGETKRASKQTTNTVLFLGLSPQTSEWKQQNCAWGLYLLVGSWKMSPWIRENVGSSQGFFPDSQCPEQRIR